MHRRVGDIAFLAALGLFGGMAGLGGQTKSTQNATAHGLIFSVIDYDNSYRWPLNIVRVSVNGKDVAIGRSIDLNAHWLEGLTIVVKNVSTKTITECGVDLAFPDSGSGSPDNPVNATQVHLGVFPDVALTRHDGTTVLRSELSPQEPIAIAPGSTAQLSFASEGPTLVAATARSETIRRVVLRLTTVYFSDSTKWMSGHYYEPTTSHNTWREMTLPEFLKDSTKEK